VQGIEAIIRGEVGVRSLQEHARRIRPETGRSAGDAGGPAAGAGGSPDPARRHEATRHDS
jgi:hypothetical protein